MNKKVLKMHLVTPKIFNPLFHISVCTAVTVYAMAFTFSIASEATELRRNTNIPLTECNSEGFSNNLPKATAYVNRIKDHILASNSEIFRGDIAPANICLGVQHNTTGGRAWAEVVHRTIRIESNLIERAQNDAQTAIIVSHELAHLAMRHTLDANPVTGSQRSVAQAAFTRIYNLLEQITNLGKGSPDHQATHSRLSRELEAQQNIISPLVNAELGANAVNNWEEAEADTVGANFYLRAGFTSDELAWRTQQIIIARANNQDAHGPPPQITAAERLSQSNAACGIRQISTMAEPERGVARYPHECWSTWRLLKREPEINSTYRSLMNDTTSIVTLPGTPTLAEVKAEIEALTTSGFSRHSNAKETPVEETRNDTRESPDENTQENDNNDSENSETEKDSD